MPVVEIAIATVRNSSGLIAPGDIVTACAPRASMGRRVRHSYLWLWIEVGDLAAINLKEGMPPYKRRYHVPLERLKARLPELDLGRATDSRFIYQPFMDADPSTGIYNRLPEVIPIADLVIDKMTRRPLIGNV